MRVTIASMVADNCHTKVKRKGQIIVLSFLLIIGIIKQMKKIKLAHNTLPLPQRPVIASRPIQRPADAEEITKMEAQPAILLIISSAAGEILGGWGGESRDIAGVVNVLSNLDDGKVVKLRDSFLTPGQTCFRLSLDILAGLRAALWFIPYSTWPTMQIFEDLIPSDSMATMIISY